MSTLPAPAPRLIGFCGPKGSGKSTAAQMLVEYTEQAWTRYSFANPIREMLRVLGVSERVMLDPDRKEKPLDTLGGKSPRQLLCSLGTTWGREHVGEHLWTNQAARRIPSLLSGTGVEGVVIDDVRFEDEAQLIRDLGGIVIELRRTGYYYTTDHRTEHGIDGDHIDQSIDADNAQQLSREIARIIAQI